MTKFSILPIRVKVLCIRHTIFCWNGEYTKWLDGWTITIGKYYVAEHSKGFFKKGDKFIIRETWDPNSR